MKRQRGRPKYSRGSPAFGLTSYRPAQAHNLLGQFSDLCGPFPSEGVFAQGSPWRWRVGGFGTNHAAWTSSRPSLQLAGGRVTFLFALAARSKGPGPAHNLSMGVGRVGRDGTRCGAALDTCCPTGAQHPIGIRIDIDIGIGVWKWSVATLRQGPVGKCWGRWRWSTLLTSDGARIADWRRCSTATATP